ncbi:hypothetical protein O5629_27095, partial [Escherichia coli]|nr:hypothetical protein [Escherichia coli]
MLANEVTARTAAQANPNAKIALISKVYPMRSHTVAAEGGSAAVAHDHDSTDFLTIDRGGSDNCDVESIPEQ